MGIIIEHMEMPKGCCECRMQTENCCTLSLRPIDDVYDRPEWCLLEEAEPVKHGTWGENIYGYRKCSVCGRVTQVDECMREPLYLYCPYCGARMDEGEESEE